MTSLLSVNLLLYKSRSCSYLAHDTYDADIALLPTSSGLGSYSDSEQLLKLVGPVDSVVRYQRSVDGAKKDSSTALLGVTRRSFRIARCYGQQFLPEIEGPENLDGSPLALPRGYKQELAELTDHHMRMSQDLDSTREELASVKHEGAKDRVCSLAAHSALGAQLLNTLQTQLDAQKTLAQETTVRDSLLNSLRQSRAQHTEISRKLRNTLFINSTLAAELDKERSARTAAENALAELASKNLGLTEQNKMLSSRELVTDLLSNKPARSMLDTAIFPSRRTMSRASSRRPSISEVFNPYESISERSSETNAPSGSICWTAEFRQATLRNKLSTIQEEYNITKGRLLIAEQRCDAFGKKLSSLQTNFNLCVDECGRALATERELRYEVERRLHGFRAGSQRLSDSDSDSDLEDDGSAIESLFPAKTQGQSVFHVRHLNAIAMNAFERCDTLEKENLTQRDVIDEYSRRIRDLESVEDFMLKDHIVRYKDDTAGLRIALRVRAEDKQFRYKTRQRLSQMKGKKKTMRAKTKNYVGAIPCPERKCVENQVTNEHPQNELDDRKTFGWSW
ncbi:hypothetical protein FIBSPDRAFT_937224 [Athelia psychrophila]|uniref:Uncharacterized protein n=1 Tax=Athelia psychrophila TaxID=1759441 RepID=A0A166AVE9_9AGAM|nr:hypothetical protein FIBSPDRAFT_937224 [Fibularhizoctonia sp. CBS 109695]